MADALCQHLLISDLDGTLLMPDRSVGPRTLRAIQRFIAAGGHFTVATGRSMPSAAATLRDVGLVLPAILHNGALTADLASGEVSDVRPLSAEAAATVFERALAAGFCPVAYALPDLDTPAGATVVVHGGDLNPPTERYVTSVAPGHRVVEARDGAPLRKMVPLSLILLDGRHRLHELFSGQCEPLGGVTCCVGHSAYTPGLGVGEVTACGASKATAAARLARGLGLDLDRVVAFGDNHNDLSLLDRAGMAYCPEDAPEAIRVRIRGRIASAGQEGVARLLEQLLEQ